MYQAQFAKNAPEIFVENWRVAAKKKPMMDPEGTLWLLSRKFNLVSASMISKLRLVQVFQKRTFRLKKTKVTYLL